jgi:acyl carrier protein
VIVGPRQSDSPRQDLLAEVIAIIAQATNEDEAWAGAVTPSCRLEGDLWLDSVELAALAGLLQSAYGDQVDLAAFLTGLEIDKLIGLTVGDLVSYIAGCLDLEGARCW